MQRVVEVPQIQSNDRVVDVPVMAQRQVLSVERVQKMVEVFCGEEKDVVGALTPVGRGVAQVFHELLVELGLLLVAVVEGRRTGGKLGSREWSMSSRRDNAHMDDMWMRCGQGSNLSQM